jgi:hypothetical protein
MILALLAGRKTQTRRIMTRNNSTVLGERWGAKAPWGGLLFDHPKAIARATSTLMCVIVGESEAPYDPHIDVPWLHPDDAARGDKWEDDECMYRVRPIWEIGDRLWVRETWAHDADDLETARIAHEDVYCDLTYGPYYHATETAPETLKWRPSIHMPRWASRLTLEVTGVKVERLREISEKDALAEGIEPGIWPRSEFVAIWDSIHGMTGPNAWGANPWVYALTFKVHKCNIDS